MGFEDVGLGEEHLDLGLAPVLGGEVLEEEDDVVEALLLDLGRALEEEVCAGVDVELVEGVFSEVGVEDAHGEGERELADEEAVHPAEGEVGEDDVVVVEDAVEVGVHLGGWGWG